MELDAFEFGAAMANAHDDAVVGFGSDSELARHGFAFNDQRMIARCGERVGEFAEDAFGVVMDGAGFAVEELGARMIFPPNAAPMA